MRPAAISMGMMASCVSSGGELPYIFNSIGWARAEREEH